MLRLPLDGRCKTSKRNVVIDPLVAAAVKVTFDHTAHMRGEHLTEMEYARRIFSACYEFGYAEFLVDRENTLLVKPTARLQAEGGFLASMCREDETYVLLDARWEQTASSRGPQ